MPNIKALTADPSPELVSQARNLFRAYGSSLREIAACHGFDFDRFDTEIASLPHPYTAANGDLLLAFADPTAAGCIAFRSAPASAGPQTCELKRLFVLPTHRQQGIAERLVLTALDHARTRGYRTAILDTEPSTMQAAQALYRKLGFAPYMPTNPHNPVNVAYLRKDLL